METPISNFYKDIVPSPCFVLEEQELENNLKLLATVQKESGAKILLALKAFSMYSSFDLTSHYLAGAAASGKYEARLAHEKMVGEVHTYSPALKENDFQEVIQLSDYLIFNSFSQWRLFRDKTKEYPEKKFGLRINPQHQEAETEIYDPCMPGSRLGVTLDEMKTDELAGISGFHFHNLCQQGLEPLKRTLEVFEEKFGTFLAKLNWVNFGGGHHITKPGYDVQGLIVLLKNFQRKHDLQIYLEPGEAITYQAGTLVGEVIDIVRNDRDIAILDISATTHMPDILEMPYRPEITGGFPAGIQKYNYGLAGPSCLAGDVIGDYSFAEPLSIGQRIVFTDMIHYTMVKTTTFNGIPLPAIAIWKNNKRLEIIKQFTYEDFKSRL